MYFSKSQFNLAYIIIISFFINSIFTINNSLMSNGTVDEKEKKFNFTTLKHSKTFATKENIISRKNLSEDSLNISRILWRLKTPYIKEKMNKILDEIAYEKRLISPYPVDFYSLNPNKRLRGELGNKRYVKNKTVYMPVDKILDSLSNIIMKSVILRINKIDFDMAKFDIGVLVDPSFDNSYLNLNLFPDLKNDKKLRTILFETILKSDKKRSFEWIWGKSTDNDAYYSTKLTAFNGAFTIYLEYRTYIGHNTFRDKNGWFYKLGNYNPSSTSEIILTTVDEKDDQPKLSSSAKSITEKSELQVDTVKKNISIKKEFKKINITKIHTPKETPFIYDSNIDTLKFNVFQYEKVVNKDKYYLDYEKTLTISEIIDSLGIKITKNVQYLKTDRTKLKFISNNVIENKPYKETIFKMDERSFADKFYNEKLKTLLAQAFNHPMKRKTIEFIYGKSKSGYSYFALVLTIFNGQITVFNEYRKNAKREYYIDKKGWFSKLPVIKI